MTTKHDHLAALLRDLRRWDGDKGAQREALRLRVIPLVEAAHGVSKLWRPTENGGVEIASRSAFDALVRAIDTLEQRAP